MTPNEQYTGCPENTVSSDNPRDSVSFKTSASQSKQKKLCSFQKARLESNLCLLSPTYAATHVLDFKCAIVTDKVEKEYSKRYKDWRRNNKDRYVKILQILKTGNIETREATYYKGECRQDI